MIERCDVCKLELSIKDMSAVVGSGCRLCMTGSNCFGWFSGYPWVLFERGILKTSFEIEFFVAI